MNIQDRILLRNLKKYESIFRKKGYFNINLTADRLMLLYEDSTIMSMSFKFIEIYQTDGISLYYTYDDVDKYFSYGPDRDHVFSTSPTKWLHQSDKLDRYGIPVSYRKLELI
jgi:hypothetical protein